MAETDDFEPTVAQDTQSSDNSKSGVRKAWDTWTSRPENNAALLQFGIAMLQPRSQSQTSLGQFGNAIGEAGEAAGRNIGAQQAEQNQQAQREERESTAELRTKQGQAALINANAYKDQVGAMSPGGANGRQLLNHQFRVQQQFRTWLAKPEDTTGLNRDPLVDAIKKEFPDIQSKADLLRNERAMQRARQLFGASLTTEAPDATNTPPAAVPTGPPPAPGSLPPGIKYDPVTQKYYKRGPDGRTAVEVPAPE